MALQDILQKILEEAASEVKSLDIALESEKKQLKSETEDKKKAQAESWAKKEEEALEAIKVKTNAMARRDAKSLQQQSRRTVIITAMENFLDHLIALPAAEYQKVLESLLKPLSGKGTLFVPENRLEETQKVAPKDFSVEASKEVKGGFVAKLPGSEVDCSFHGLVFSEYRNEMESFFAQKLNLI